MIYILDTSSNQLVEAEIIPLTSKVNMPLKKDGWNFNWRLLTKQNNTQAYVLKLINNPKTVEGALQLRVEDGIMIMDVLEIAPHNVGKEKRYDYVAGVLIAYACRESFKLESNYKGFLTFVSKTKLIEWYKKKYGAESALGQRMFIAWESGQKLIEKYLNRSNDE
ncbi:MAG: hypothetical protein DRJ09_02130 [Bacteroidetes bacterium]|nr:MAG: hypothetical protein DRJ09_02130 [Bacteroidota bacterium]